MPTAADQLVPGAIVTGPLLPEPIEVLATVPMGTALKVIGRGLRTNQVHQPVLDAGQVAQLTVSPKDAPFDGDALRFRLGIEGHRLGLAYEYDPYFSLSIARIDPLPHQLEAVYEYFLKVPRIRFLLADDPGAGKTIMAGLLLKELKTRGLVKRTLIVTPANLTFQWQRELKDKFREAFHVVRGDVLRAGYGSNPWAEHDQIITSVSWASIIEDAKESLLRTSWDLVIVDEAHKMSPTFEDIRALRAGKRSFKLFVKPDGRSRPRGRSTRRWQRASARRDRRPSRRRSTWSVGRAKIPMAVQGLMMSEAGAPSLPNSQCASTSGCRDWLTMASSAPMRSSHASDQLLKSTPGTRAWRKRPEMSCCSRSTWSKSGPLCRRKPFR